MSQLWSTLLGMRSCYGRYPSTVRHGGSRSAREVLVKVQCSGQECPEHEAGGLTGARSGLAVPTFVHLHRGFSDSIPRASCRDDRLVRIAEVVGRKSLGENGEQWFSDHSEARG